MKINKKYLKDAIIFILLSIIYTLLVKFVDVKAIGPQGTKVGFSHLNEFFHNIIGVNMTLYKVTEILGYLAILLIGIYAIIGLYQLFKRKSLLKVDKDIYVLGALYAVLFALYIFFEKVIINYRPVLIDNVLEASYPSSHTMLALVIFGSSILINNKLFIKRRIARISNTASIILMCLIVFGRTLSGVHWITDIMGGIIISCTLLYIFKFVLNMDGE